MGLFDSPRTKLAKLVRPRLNDGEEIEGGLAYGTTGSYLAWTSAALAGSPARAIGVVVTSTRVFMAEWDERGTPHLAVELPRADVRGASWKPGRLASSVTLRAAGRGDLTLVSSGLARGDAEDLASLLT